MNNLNLFLISKFFTLCVFQRKSSFCYYITFNVLIIEIYTKPVKFDILYNKCQFQNNHQLGRHSISGDVVDTL